jgi:hypothetical protein
VKWRAKLEVLQEEFLNALEGDLVYSFWVLDRLKVGDMKFESRKASC